MSPPEAGNANGRLLEETAAAMVLDDAWAGISIVDEQTGPRPNAVLVVAVVINDDGRTRSYIVKSLASAERAVDRARARGREAVVTLCELKPLTEVVL